MFLGNKVRLVRRADNLSRMSRQFGILNISQPYRPPRPVSFTLLCAKKQFMIVKGEEIFVIEDFNV
jgi:hypothetical protein